MEICWHVFPPLFYYNCLQLFPFLIYAVDVKCLCRGCKMSSRATSLCSYNYLFLWDLDSMLLTFENRILLMR